MIKHWLDMLAVWWLNRRYRGKVRFGVWQPTTPYEAFKEKFVGLRQPIE